MFKIRLLIFAVLAVDLHTVNGLIGGIKAGKGEFPHHALLKSNRQYFCNGALISSKHVLTSGHCIEMAIVSGEVSAMLGSNEMYRGGTIYKTVDRVIHPYYGRISNKMLFDLGIFTLETDVAFSGRYPITPALLPSSNENYIHENAKVSSMGSTTLYGRTVTYLQKLEVNIIAWVSCLYRLRCNDLIDKSHVCVSKPMGTGFSNNGDGGSPLVVGCVITGIALDNIKLNTPENIDIYTNVSYYRSWIDQNLN